MSSLHLSLFDPVAPNPASCPEGDRESLLITRGWGDLFVTLLREQVAKDGFGNAELEEQFRTYENGRVIALSSAGEGAERLGGSVVTANAALNRILGDVRQAAYCT
jgi:hypothetical protein